jgi:hypothetical protein
LFSKQYIFGDVSPTPGIKIESMVLLQANTFSSETYPSPVPFCVHLILFHCIDSKSVIPIEKTEIHYLTLYDFLLCHQTHQQA